MSGRTQGASECDISMSVTGIYYASEASIRKAHAVAGVRLG